MHYITIWVMADVVGGMLCNKEPDKKDNWRWHDCVKKIPEEPHFGFSINEAIKESREYFLSS